MSAAHEHVVVFVNGTSMHGGSNHQALTGARMVGQVRTLPRYRMYAVDGGFPGLVNAADNGSSLTGELYEMTYQQVAEELLPTEPKVLEMGVILLQGGGGALGMFLRDTVVRQMTFPEITRYGNWSAYIAANGA